MARLRGWPWRKDAWRKDDYATTYIDPPRPERLDRMVIVDCDPYLSSRAPDTDMERQVGQHREGMAWIGPTLTTQERRSTSHPQKNLDKAPQPPS